MDEENLFRNERFFFLLITKKKKKKENKNVKKTYVTLRPKWTPNESELDSGIGTSRVCNRIKRYHM